MKRLEETYADAYKIAVENNIKAIKKFDALTDEALKDLTPEARVLKREAFAREIKRTKTLQNNIGAEIANAGDTAAKIIQGELNNIYNLNYNFANYSVQRQAGVVIDFTVYDKNQIAVLVQENQSPFTKIAYKNLGEDKIVTQRLQKQFIQGITNGESQQQLKKRIRTVTGQSVNQSKRVAQTERNRVQSQGRQHGFDEAERQGVEMQKQWVARMRNTRDLHELTNLEIVNNDEAFSNGLEYPGDPSGYAENVINCFCYVKPMVKSISPALAAHRAWAQDKAFGDYLTQTGGNVIGARTELEYQTLRLKESERILAKTGSNNVKENVRLATGAKERAEKVLEKEVAKNKLAIKKEASVKTVKREVKEIKPPDTKKLQYRSGKEIDSMNIAELKKASSELAKIYYPISGISFGNISHEEVIRKLQIGATKASLAKDVKSMQKRLKQKGLM